MKLLFASANVNKIIEIRSLLPAGYILETLYDKGFEGVLEENGNTLDENALQKARFVNKRYQINCFSDDSGLEITKLGGKPGVNSAHYAGLPRNDDKNIELVLDRLKGSDDRSARFRTVIALIVDGEEHCFEGTLDGVITTEKIGDHGFGYDPVFIPLGMKKTLAQLEPAEKNRISHRSVAVKKLVAFLSALAEEKNIYGGI